ncbi:Ubiquinone biosynthesis protein [Komagataella phaffii CBS 7435]|uniref:Ubiquinone biosynthesis protein COQ4, mitochondrial n=2 Tax=Komagataella phaffii TaxID=460519 RepID=COQ4_KOMPG|nr:Protein with a role in ubiquinone (Coenzyme Q) biosynthesis [Komagataella phaffii GS115]C4R5D8.1 RecName: Full=Ubiquinone biosynthesis protein COQ4, mitochondrial; AltName: Full=Coenzyme Q biosynthesis protein 4 [Komagataella phaffii GS115]AOA63403.1 GQ67_03818T0 [Komagataella phaffii]CAH2449444.1 Ubiquinone biosynthesis protein [Komagataella phaffii CBS 7435]AOA69187.1 GQ68_03791T0 [Komagataella phaffii GS115]CAY70774.1 Protein with a role in ubiquinone (Coenzyme Q) biosynthesis [Komagatae
MLIVQQFQKRSFIIPSLISSGLSYLSKDIRLADKMEDGELHFPKTEFEKSQNTSRPLFQRPEPNYPGHVPLYNFEKLLMFLGSSIGAFVNPTNNNFIVSLGESTAFPWVLNRLRTQMLNDPSGRQILKERPHMTSKSLNLDELKNYPDNSLGKSYFLWLEREGVSPDTRVPVKYITDPELAFVFQRYRECHDFYHTITGLPIVREGEIALKLFEFMNLGIPMTGLGALFAPIPIKSSQRRRLLSVYYPWAVKNGTICKPLINVYWEKIMKKDIDVLRSELGIEKPPDMRELRKKARSKKKQVA